MTDEPFTIDVDSLMSGLAAAASEATESIAALFSPPVATPRNRAERRAMQRARRKPGAPRRLTSGGAS